MSSVIALTSCVVAGAMAGLAGGYCGVELRGQAAQSEIRTHRLVLVNEAGDECGRLQGGDLNRPGSAYLSLGGDPNGPMLLLSVDTLEGEPAAKLYMRSPGVETGELGIATFQSHHGHAQIALSDCGSSKVDQHVELGKMQIGQETVLRFSKENRPIAAWPQ